MKKLAILLFLFMLSIGASLTGWNQASAETHITTELLTAEQAREILQEWLDNHPFDRPAVLAFEHDEYSDGSAEYYHFSLDDMERYWLNFLVHKQTKSLYFMMISDGEEAVIEIEPLDDWYNKYY